MLTTENIRIEEAIRDSMELATLEKSLDDLAKQLLNRIDDRRTFEKTLGHLMETITNMSHRDIALTMIMLAHGVPPESMRGPQGPIGGKVK